MTFLRNLFTLGASLSLLLCLAANIWWVRSYWVFDIWASATSPVGGQHVFYSEGRR